MRRGRQIDRTAAQVRIQYKNHDITYIEVEDKWVVTEPDKAETLAELGKLADAKAWIDRRERGGFQRITAYRDTGGYGWREGRTFEKVVVTSLIPQKWGGPEAWVQVEREGHRPERSKIPAKALYAVTPENEALMEKITALRKQIRELTAENDTLFRKLEGIPIPKDVEDQPA